MSFRNLLKTRSNQPNLNNENDKNNSKPMLHANVIPSPIEHESSINQPPILPPKYSTHIPPHLRPLPSLTPMNKISSNKNVIGYNSQSVIINTKDELLTHKRNAFKAKNSLKNRKNSCDVPISFNPKPRDYKRPTKPPSAFFLYAQEKRGSIQQQFPSKTFRQITKDISVKWQALSISAKSPYRLEAQHLKLKYESALQAHKDSIQNNKYQKKLKEWEHMQRNSNKSQRKKIKRNTQRQLESPQTEHKKKRKRVVSNQLRQQYPGVSDKEIREKLKVKRKENNRKSAKKSRLDKKNHKIYLKVMIRNGLQFKEMLMKRIYDNNEDNDNDNDNMQDFAFMVGTYAKLQTNSFAEYKKLKDDEAYRNKIIDNIINDTPSDDGIPADYILKPKSWINNTYDYGWNKIVIDVEPIEI